MRGPTFFIAGGVRCGTTTLYRYMQQHPDILMSTPKEPHFFDARYERGWQSYLDDHYGSQFQYAAVGEATPTYLFLPFCAERIVSQRPDAKIVVTLRNPIDRAYSHWWMFKVRGIDRLPFEEAVAGELQGEPETFDGPDGPRRWIENRESFRTGQSLLYRSYLSMGYYADQLQRLDEHFPPDQVLTLLLDDLEAQPHETVRRIWRFVDVDPTVDIQQPPDHNSALSPRLGPLMRFAQATGAIRLMPRVPEPLRWRLKRFAIAPSARPPMAPAIRQQLLEHFEPHIRALESLLDVDLKHWRRSGATATTENHPLKEESLRI